MINPAIIMMNESHGLIVNGYTLDKLLGKGAFAKVFRAAKLRSEGASAGLKERYAIKIIETANVDSGLWSLMNYEADLMLGFDHRNVLQALEVQRFPRYIAIVMPCMGSSLEQLQKNIPTSRRTWTLREVVNGIKYLHCEKNLAHMDVKPANVLLDPSLEAIKLCDFGFTQDGQRGKSIQHLSCSMGAVLLAWLLTYGRSASFGCLLRPV
eukprot:TRINITY_DN11776_c0_g3_i1.p2 TRINITY_DN11776_c0_g3~~TRINITY_DN11776_c0_g3_i1.p2  ORF type:complete len:210 (+),score=21.81 TRINITY_DN11776_c0_g3_i1:214-843(+)